MIAPFEHSSYACLQVLSSVAFAIGLLVVSTLLLHQSIHLQELLTTAPLVAAPIPQVTAPIPRVTAPIPRVTALIPQVTAPIPRVTALLSHVTASVPHVTAVLSHVTAMIPQVAAPVPQVGVVCFRFGTMASQLINTIIYLRIPKTKRNKRLLFLSNKGLQPWHH